MDPKYVNYPYRQGVLGLIINQQNQLLLTQLTDYPPNHWRFPGGGINSKETPKQALHRELQEELGISQIKIGPKSIHLNQYEWSNQTIKKYIKQNQYFKGQIQQIYLTHFIGEKKDLIINSNEIKQIKWVNLNHPNLKKYFIYPNQWNIIQKTLKEFNLIPTN